MDATALDSIDFMIAETFPLPILIPAVNLVIRIVPALLNVDAFPRIALDMLSTISATTSTTVALRLLIPRVISSIIEDPELLSAVFLEENACVKELMRLLASATILFLPDLIPFVREVIILVPIEVIFVTDELNASAKLS